MKKIVNARVFINNDFVNGGVVFDNTFNKCGDTVISESNDTDMYDEVIDAKGKIIIPGLVDIHTHGANGVDTSELTEERISLLSRYYVENGITSYCPTFATISENQIRDSLSNIDKHVRKANEARIAGTNLEGPFVSQEMLGSQNPKYQKNPDIDFYNRIASLYNVPIKLITVAPELKGAVSFIECLHDDTTISIGHTRADYTCTQKAFGLGANHVTHIYNRMNPISHREPGVIPAALESGATVELICDGVHVHESIVRLTFKLFENRICLISDSLLCAGVQPGLYDFGGVAVENREDAVYIDGSNNLAGSNKNLMDGLKKAIEFGIPINAAINAATIYPAKVIKEDANIGSIEVGKKADFIIVNDDFDIESVFIDGVKNGGYCEL